MTIYDDIFPLGLGTNRFNISNANDEAGIETAVNLVLKTLDSGVEYIDTAHTYSKGMAFHVLKQVFMMTKNPYRVTLKTQLAYEKTSDDVMRRVESTINSLGISKFEYGVLWTVMNYNEYQTIMQKGGVYDGLVRLRNEGVIKRITMSTHAPVADIISILNDRTIEGLTISYSILNHDLMKPVLDKALEQDIGIVVMNPLGGGIIPNNEKFFSFIKNDSDEDVAVGALRFVKSHPSVRIVLVGLSSQANLTDALAAYRKTDIEEGSERIRRVTSALRTIDNFCTGCGYCSTCPQSIPISSIMQSRNTLLLSNSNTYNRSDEELSKNIEVCRKLWLDFSILPDSPKNACIRCGMCEERCTQNLDICDAIEETYGMFDATGYSKTAHKERIDKLLNGFNYKRVGFYPAGGSTAKVIDTYLKEFGEPPFEIVLFDSNPSMCGTLQGGYRVFSAEEIPQVQPDCIVISNYKFQEEIYDGVSKYESDGVHIKRLYAVNDVPWMF